MNIAQQLYAHIGGTALFNTAPWQNEEKKETKKWESTEAKLKYKLRKRYTHILSDVITERNLAKKANE